MKVILDFPSKKDIFDFLDLYVFHDTVLLLGISGGPDSMFMFHIVEDFFFRKGFDFQHIHIAHYNHQARPESDQEQSWLEKNFSNFSFHTSRYTAKTKTELAMRKARHGFFAKLMTKVKADYLVLGHNLTDRIETTLLNMMRGATLEGFLNMQAVDEVSIIKKKVKILRPLLTLPKQDIQSRCEHNKIQFITDMSNFNSKTSKRNFIRNNFLQPLYSKSNKTKDGTNKFIQSWQNIYTELQEVNTAQPLDLHPISLSRYWHARRGYEIVSAPSSIQQIVWLFKEFGIYKNISKAILQEYYDFLTGKSEGYKYLQGVYFFKSHGRIYIIQAPEGFWQQKIDENKKINKIGKYKIGDFQINIQDTRFIGSILRFPQPSDRFKGKKLSKYLLNQKVPIFRRPYWPVIVKDDKVIWVYDLSAE